MATEEKQKGKMDKASRQPKDEEGTSVEIVSNEILGRWEYPGKWENGRCRNERQSTQSWRQIRIGRQHGTIEGRRWRGIAKSKGKSDKKGRNERIKENIGCFFIFINKTSRWVRSSMEKGIMAGIEKRRETRKDSRKTTGSLDGAVCDCFWITTKCKIVDSGRRSGKSELYTGYSSTTVLFSTTPPPSLPSQDRKFFLRVSTTGKSLFLKIPSSSFFRPSWFSTTLTLLHGLFLVREGLIPLRGKLASCSQLVSSTPFGAVSLDFRRFSCLPRLNWYCSLHNHYVYEIRVITSRMSGAALKIDWKTSSLFPLPFLCFVSCCDINDTRG